jgi:threonine/homoserine/homoserine lactone efflux protein
MLSVHTVVIFLAASLALLVVPGPAVLYIVTRSLSQGRAAGLVSTLGVETGGIVHVVAATAGVSAVIASSAIAFTVLKYAGACYLIYLGVRKLFAHGTGFGPAVNPVPLRRLFRDGVIVNVLNPKTAIFFLAFLPQFVDPQRGPAALQILALGLLFLLTATISDGTYALVAGSARGLVARSSTGGRLPNRLSGVVFIALGVLTAISGHRPRTV